MKTIVYLISTLHRTGPTNVLAGIVKNLDKTKFTPVVITLSPEKNEENSWRGELEAQGVTVYSLNLSRFAGVLLAKRKLTRLIESISPELIHAHCFRSTLVAASFKGYKKVVTVHCDWRNDFTMAYGKIGGTIMALLYQKALNYFDQRIACSKMLADLLNQKYPSMYFDFVDNGVDTEKFCPVKDKKALRQKLGLPLDKKIIIWAGNFLPVKDPFVMVKIILQFPVNQYYFVFCGTGPLLDVCKERLKNRKDVLFTGYVTNIEKYFQSADMYVSTSKSEGFHLTVYEAMACGLPVILTDIGVYSNLRNNLAVSFFQPKNVSALAVRINNLVEQDFPLISKQARQTVQQHFSTTQMAQNYQNIYEKMV